MIKRKGYILLFVVVSMIIFGSYFVKIVIVDNKEMVLNVLVLDINADTEKMKKDLHECINPEKNERIEITKIDSNVPANYPIILTWIRSRTFDLIIAEQTQLESFAKTGCFSPLRELLDSGDNSEYDFYECGLAEYDDEGNVLTVGEKIPLGIYIKKFSQLYKMQHPVASVVINAPNVENAIKMLRYWSEN